MTRSPIHTLRALAREKGQALVEFALAATLIFFLLAATIDLGLIFFAMQGITNAAQEGATYGSRWLEEDRVDYDEIYNRARLEAGRNGGIAVVNLTDLNSNGRPDVDGLVGADETDPNDYEVLTADYNPSDYLPNNTPIISHHIEIQVARVSQQDLILMPLEEAQDEAFANAGTLDNPGTRWCHDPNVVGDSCYLKVTVRIRYNLFFALAPAFADSVELSSSYVRQITGEGFAPVGETDVDAELEDALPEGLSPDDDPDGDGMTNEEECPGFVDIQDIRSGCPDSDNDGVPDYLESNVIDEGNPEHGGGDTDGDGIANALDPDDDGDGLPTYWECYYDQPMATGSASLDILCLSSDDDDTPDFLDTDDDNDGFRTGQQAPDGSQDECSSYTGGADFDPTSMSDEDLAASDPALACPDSDVDGIPDHLDPLNDTLILGGTCETAEDCEEGAECVEGVCQPVDGCLSDTDCPANTICDIASGSCVAADTTIRVRLIDQTDAYNAGTDMPDNQLVETNSETRFAAWGWDEDQVTVPDAPTAAENGTGIDGVTLRLRSPSGLIVRSAYDPAKPYCLFGQDGSDCNTWDDGAYIDFDDAEEGEYILSAQASSGTMPSLTITRTFTLETENIAMGIYRTDEQDGRAEMSRIKNENVVAKRADSIFDAVPLNPAEADRIDRVRFRVESVFSDDDFTVTVNDNTVLPDGRYCMYYTTDGNACAPIPDSRFNGMEPGDYIISVRVRADGSWHEWVRREFVLDASDIFISFFQADPNYVLFGNESNVTVDFPDTGTPQQVYREDQMMAGVIAYSTNPELVGGTPSETNGDNIDQVHFEFRNTVAERSDYTTDTPETVLEGYCPRGITARSCNPFRDEESDEALEDLDEGLYFMLAQATDTEGRRSNWYAREIEVGPAPFDETIEFVLPQEVPGDDPAVVRSIEDSVFSVTIYDPNVGTRQVGTDTETHGIGNVEFVIADSDTSFGNRLFESTANYEDVAQPVFCMADGDTDGNFEAPGGDACPPMTTDAFSSFDADGTTYWFWVRAQSPRGRWSEWVKQPFVVELSDLDVMIVADTDTGTFTETAIYLNDDTRFKVMAHDPNVVGLPAGSRGQVTDATNGEGVEEVQVRIKHVDSGQYLTFDGFPVNADNAWTITEGSDPFYCVFGVDSDEPSKCAPMPELEKIAKCSSSDECEPGDLSDEDLDDLEHEIANGEYVIQVKAKSSEQEDTWSSWKSETFTLRYAPIDISIAFDNYPDDDATLDDYNDNHDEVGAYLADHTRAMAYACDPEIDDADDCDGNDTEAGNGIGIEDVQFRLYYDYDGSEESPVSSYYDYNGDSLHDGNQTDDPFCAFDEDEDDKDGDSDTGECQWLEIDCDGDICNLGDNKLLTNVSNQNIDLRVRAKAQDGRWSDWDDVDEAFIEIQAIGAPIDVAFIDPNVPAGSPVERTLPDKTINSTLGVNDTPFRADVRRAGTTANGTGIERVQFRVFDPFATLNDVLTSGCDTFTAGTSRCYHKAETTAPTTAPQPSYCVYGTTNGIDCDMMANVVSGNPTVNYDYLSTGVPHTIAAWAKLNGGTWSGTPVTATFEIPPANIDIEMMRNYDQGDGSPILLSDTDVNFISHVTLMSRFQLSNAQDLDVGSAPILAVEFQMWDETTQTFVDLTEDPTFTPRLSLTSPANDLSDPATVPICMFGPATDTAEYPNQTCAPAPSTLTRGNYELQVRVKTSSGWSIWKPYAVQVGAATVADFRCGASRAQGLMQDGWQTADIGTAATATVASASSDGWVAMCGGQGGLADSDNGVYYTWKTAPASFKEITAKVSAFANVDQGSGTASAPASGGATGLMVRSSNDPDADMYAVMVTADGGVQIAHRVGSLGGQTNHYSGAAYPLGSVADADTAEATQPIWLKIKQVAAGQLVAFYSTDGITWVQMGSDPFVKVISSVAHIGFFAHAGGGNEVVKAGFEDISVTSGTLEDSQPVASVDCNGNPPLQSWSEEKFDTGNKSHAYGDPAGAGYLAICGPKKASNIWGRDDEMHYVYRTVPDTFTEFKARIDVWNESGDFNDTTTDLAAWAKAVLMVRQTNTDSSNYFGVLISGNNAISVYQRPTDNANTTNMTSDWNSWDLFRNDPKNPIVTGGDPVPVNPIWLRIERTADDRFLAYYTRDPDGEDDWVLLMDMSKVTEDIEPITPPFQVGFGLSSHNNTQPYVLFNHITVMCGTGSCP